MSTVIRVEKNENYTVLSNHHFKNKDLSYRAVGLLSVMLSVPDNWDFTLAGLAALHTERIDAVRTVLVELENAGYVERKRIRNNKGQLTDTEYIIREFPVVKSNQPKSDEPTLEKPTLVSSTKVNPIEGAPALDNTTELNTHESNTKESNTNAINSVVYDGTHTRETAKKEVDNYLINRSLSFDSYFGVTPEIRESVKLIADAIFDRFTLRKPNDQDVMRVFKNSCICKITDTNCWVINIDYDRKDLLMYAFEAAAMSGANGNWNYIERVLQSLHERGINTLHDAERYDEERIIKKVST